MFVEILVLIGTTGDCLKIRISFIKFNFRQYMNLEVPFVNLESKNVIRDSLNEGDKTKLAKLVAITLGEYVQNTI